MRLLKTGLDHSLTYRNPLDLLPPQTLTSRTEKLAHTQIREWKRIRIYYTVCRCTHTYTRTHALHHSKRNSLVCMDDNCALTLPQFGCSHFSVQGRGSYICYGVSGSSSCGTEGEKKKKRERREKLRATPLEMSFTAALPQKSNVSLKWSVLEKTLRALKQTHSQLTTALRRAWQSVCRNSGFLRPLDCLSFPLAPLFSL